MSSTTWTPPEVGSRARAARLALWRAVEAQHVASTTRLTDDLADQLLLEQILERSKPALPPEAQPLHYLLATPFRYPSPFGSRFRAPTDPGVFYGADEARTACAELGYWRWRFLVDAPGVERIEPVPHTVFRAAVAARTVDLRRGAFVRDRVQWTDPVRYEATQAFARTAREAGVAVIRYQSVRDPRHGGCAAVLDPRVFREPRRPLAEQTWFLTVTRLASAWQRGSERLEFRWVEGD